MSIFQDKKYENLDWLSQATQPIDSPLNSVLASLPDSLTIDYSFLEQYVSDSARINFDSILSDMIRQISESSQLTWEQRQNLLNCFEIEPPEENIIVDFVNKTMSSPIYVVKKTFTFEDTELQKTLGHKGLSELRSISYRLQHANSRINEIIELIGSADEEILSSRSMRKKIQYLVAKMRSIFAKNEWNIRDADLADKLSIWAKDYIEKGTLSSLANFCKVKIMTHSGAPIYSIVEEQ